MALLLSLLVAAAGCASAPKWDPDPGPAAPGQNFDAAIVDLRSGSYAAAARALRDVRRRCAGRPLGVQAFLVLAAADLDPRGRQGPPDRAAQMTAEFLAGAEGPAWTRPVAEALFLAARDLGGELGSEAEASDAPAGPAGEVDAEGACGARWGSRHGGPEAGRLPALPRAALHARVRALEAEVERLRELLKRMPEP